MRRPRMSTVTRCPPATGSRPMSTRSRPTTTGVAPTSSAARATIAVTPGVCAADTTWLDALMMPTFSPATSSGVSPSIEWSRSTSPMTATSAATTLVASQRPPSPTSITPTSTASSARCASAMAVSSSKKVTGWAWSPSRSSARASISRAMPSTSVWTSANTSGAIACRPTRMRSRTSWRWGETYVPVRRPIASSSAVTIRTVEPFPFVPVTCTVR